MVKGTMTPGANHLSMTSLKPETVRVLRRIAAQQSKAHVIRLFRGYAGENSVLAALEDGLFREPLAARIDSRASELAQEAG